MYLLEDAVENFQVPGRQLVAQLNRPLVVLSGIAPAERSTVATKGHDAKAVNGQRIILSRGLLDPHQRLLVVR